MRSQAPTPHRSGGLAEPRPRSRSMGALSRYSAGGVAYEGPPASSLAPGLPPTLAEREVEVDPELVALPAPSRRDRTLTVLVLLLAAVAALGMAAALRSEVAYALSSASPRDLGDLRTATPDALHAADNHLVRAEGMLGVAGGIRYERFFVDDTFRTLPVAGRHDVWVDLRVPAGQEGGRWEPPATIAGRLVRFAAAGPRHRSLEAAIEASTGAGVPPGAWLLVEGEAPEGARWSVALAALFVGCAMWNLLAIARLTRRVH